MTRIKYLGAAALLYCTGPYGLSAGTVSPIQSNASPFGLDAVGPVELAGSDADAAEFSNNSLPGLQEIVNNTLSESQSINNLSSIALNPNDLILSGSSEIRAYFVGEGAGYRNSLGVYSGESSQTLTGDAALIFPDASSSSGYLNPTAYSYRSSRAPLAPGDFVDLGTYEDSTQLNFFIISNGANGGNNIYYTDTALNSDGLDHFVVLATPENPYLLIGTEDLPGGGDRDYNDVVFALKVGTATTQALLAKAVPLPAPFAALLGPLAFSLLCAWRRKKNLRG